MAVASNGVTRWSLVGTSVDCTGGKYAPAGTSASMVTLVPSALMAILHGSSSAHVPSAGPVGNVPSAGTVRASVRRLCEY